MTWFMSYLSKRRQYVADNNVSSSEAMVDDGIPQGSIIGPLIFIIYINDIVHSSSCLKYIVFADDTNNFISFDSLRTLFRVMNNELKRVNDWISSNKLTLNLKKTMYCSIESRNHYRLLNNMFRLPIIK